MPISQGESSQVEIAAAEIAASASVRDGVGVGIKAATAAWPVINHLFSP